MRISIPMSCSVTSLSARSQNLLLRRLRRAIRAVCDTSAEVNLRLTGDREIRSLNRKFANEDHATDVLSFTPAEGLSFAHGPRFLGDIIISVPTARRQARELHRTIDDELLHLSVHGLAHLFGYDHASQREEETMFAWETGLRQIACGRGAVPPYRVDVG